MGFASGSVTFRRYFIRGRHPASLSPKWLSALEEHRFGRQGHQAADGIETGWIGPRHLFDSDFDEPERITVGPFVHIGMRMDRTDPPGDVVRSYRKMEEEAAAKAANKPRLSNAERQQAREAAQERADREARAGAYRRMKAYPVLIDLAEGAVYFSSLGNGAGDKLVELFSRTFGLGITAGTTPEIGHRLADADGLARAFEDVRPAHFVEPPDSGDGSAAYGELDRSFLGREFLTWLWYHVDVGEGVFRERGQSKVAVSLERIMHLRCGFAQSGDSTIRTDAPAGAPESRAALRIGKQPAKAGLLLASNGDGWALTLDALRFNVSGLIVPAPDTDELQAVLEHRFTQVRRAAGVLDQLFARFLRCRLTSRWSKQQAAISRWTGADQGGKNANLRLIGG